MAEVYYYMPVKEVPNAVDCGIKLSQWHDREVMIGGEVKRCMSALLNPKDDLVKYKSDAFRCLKFELAPKYCHIADRTLLLLASEYPEMLHDYYRSIVPIEEYHFGAYRMPECLVTSTVIGDQIALLDKRMDSPILFDNSEELYAGNVVEGFKEKFPDFYEILVHLYFDACTRKGLLQKFESAGQKLAVFINREKGIVFSSRNLEIPDLF